MDAALEALVQLETGGGAMYFGEPVTQRAHALQSAALAAADGAPDPLIAAALLHDIGHLLHAAGEDIADQGIDMHHEVLGAEWLLARFGPAVAEPVRLHVAAKRWLVACEPGYAAQLSAASQQSLALQGGTMAAAEAESFRALPYAPDAIRLRRWDDAAKIENWTGPDLDHWFPLLERLQLM